MGLIPCMEVLNTGVGDGTVAIMTVESETESEVDSVSIADVDPGSTENDD